MADVERSLRRLFPEGYRAPRASHVTRWGKVGGCVGGWVERWRVGKRWLGGGWVSGWLAAGMGGWVAGWKDSGWDSWLGAWVDGWVGALPATPLPKGGSCAGSKALPCFVCCCQPAPPSLAPPLQFTLCAQTSTQDPYCYGAYSFVPPGGKKAYYDWMGHPGGLQRDEGMGGWAMVASVGGASGPAGVRMQSGRGHAHALPASRLPGCDQKPAVLTWPSMHSSRRPPSACLPACSCSPSLPPSCQAVSGDAAVDASQREAGGRKVELEVRLSVHVFLWLRALCLCPLLLLRLLLLRCDAPAPCLHSHRRPDHAPTPCPPCPPPALPLHPTSTYADASVVCWGGGLQGGCVHCAWSLRDRWVGG